MKVKRTRCPFAMLFCLSFAFCIIVAVSSLAEEKVENPAEPSKKQVLRLVHPQGLHILNNLFLQLHPEISIEYVDWNPNDTSVYMPYGNPIQEFRCDDPTTPVVDIYILSAVEGLTRLKREGYVLDLSSSEIISSAHGTYFPQAQDVLSANGKPVAVPIRFEVAGWDYNKKAWEALGLPDVPKTAEGIVQLLSRWNQDIVLSPETALYGNGGWYDIKIELLMDVLRMYIIENGTSSAALNFDTPEFRDIVNHIVNLPTLPYTAATREPLLLCHDRLYPNMISLLDIETGDWYKYGRMIGHDSQLELILPMGFSEGKAAKVGAEIEVICIASNTQNRELAMEYAEFVLEHQADLQEDLRAMLTLDVREMDALGIQKETQTFYYNLVPSISFDIGALGKFLTMNDDGDYYWHIFLNAYNLSYLGGAYGTVCAQLINLMREDIYPLIANLNKQAQNIFADRH